MSIRSLSKFEEGVLMLVLVLRRLFGFDRNFHRNLHHKAGPAAGRLVRPGVSVVLPSV